MITATMEVTGRHVLSWLEAFSMVGMRPVGMSQFADFQAECLLKRVINFGRFDRISAIMQEDLTEILPAIEEDQ
ncbi:hypothetical protein L1887_01591 [Cichorium endivia]|nr:hypothetical protein L1887_01591 [Cichorium endivia]